MKLAPDLEMTLRAAVDRIIPADEYPAASENGAIEYICRLIESDTTGALLYLYETGLAGLDAEALATCGRPFHALGAKECDAVLSEVELGIVHTHWPLPTSEFFLSLVNHTTEGYYCSPDQGANVTGAAWRMVGFPNRTGTEAQ